MWHDFNLLGAWIQATLVVSKKEIQNDNMFINVTKFLKNQIKLDAWEYNMQLKMMMSGPESTICKIGSQVSLRKSEVLKARGLTMGRVWIRY